MKDIEEIKRLESPAPKPQSIAWDGRALWMGSRETRRIYRIEPAAWAVTWETAAPGTPWGMTAVGGELRVLCGEAPDDNRFIRRCIPGQGFDADFRLPCPDDAGSQLGWDGKRLHVSQWHPQKVLALGADGKVERVIRVPHGPCGQVIVDGYIYLLTTDDEVSTDYWVTRVNARAAIPQFEDLLHVPFAGRGLTFDGAHFWTNHREKNQMVAFARPA